MKFRQGSNIDDLIYNFDREATHSDSTGDFDMKVS